jgi:hypothetical protein
MTPRVRYNISNSDLRRRIATYFRDVLGKPLNKLLALLPEITARRGKVRHGKRRLSLTLSWEHDVVTRLHKAGKADKQHSLLPPSK